MVVSIFTPSDKDVDELPWSYVEDWTTDIYYTKWSLGNIYALCVQCAYHKQESLAGSFYPSVLHLISLIWRQTGLLDFGRYCECISIPKIIGIGKVWLVYSLDYLYIFFQKYYVIWYVPHSCHIMNNVFLKGGSYHQLNMRIDVR